MTEIAKRFLGVVVLHRAAEMALGQDSRAYPAPHCGRPGEVGGSLPREECAPEAEKPDLFVFDEYHGKSTLPDELLNEVNEWGGDRAWAGAKAVGYSAINDVFILRHVDELVGIAAMSQYTITRYLEIQLPGPALLLKWIATKRTGPNAYGTRLMLRVVQHAIERGYGLCGTSTDEALPFYEALGATVFETDTGVNNVIFVSLAKLKRLTGGQRSTLELDETADIDWAVWAKLEPADGVFAIMLEEAEEPQDEGEMQRGGPKSGYHRPHKGRPGQVGGSAPREATAAGEAQGSTGQCYYTAGRWMMDNAGQIDNARLAHGTAIGQGPIKGVEFGHAWVEIGGAIAIDTETGLAFPKEQYYKVGQITDIVLYTYDEMLKEMLKHEHYGPWHEGAVRSSGWRSYPAPHCGRPGEVGGSLPREECAPSVEAVSEEKAKGRYPEGEDATTGRIDEWLVDDLPGANSEYIQEKGWRSASDLLVGQDVRGKVARKISDDVDVDPVNTLAITRLWATNAADEDLRSLHLQRLAAEEFGMPVRPAILERIAKVIEERDILLEGRELRPEDDLLSKHRSFAEYGISEADQKRVLRAMYDNTQERLAEAGFGPKDTIRLRRGTYVKRNIQINWSTGQEIELVGNPLSSWSVGADKAENFAIDPPRYLKSFGVIFEMDVPREAILSTARTGLGTLWEGEFVLLMDKKGHRAKVVEMYAPRARAGIVSARNGGDIPVIDIDWCEENEEWLRNGEEREGLLSTEKTMEATVKWWRENMPERYKGLLDATLKEKESDNA